MSASSQLPDLPVQVGGALAVPTQPTEMAYPLRRDEFDLLCETETINEDKRWRDISIAFFAAAFAGVIGLIGSIDWDSTFKSQHWAPLVYTAILGVVTVSSFVIFVIQEIKVRRSPVSSGYMRVKYRITAHYEQHHELSDADRWTVLSSRLWKAARTVKGAVGGSINGPWRKGASTDVEMRLNVGTYRINVPDAASFDEVEVIAAQQIKDADAKLAEVKIKLIATLAAPTTVALGKALKLTYEVECSDDVAEDTARGIWLGASFKDAAGKLFFNTKEDRAIALTKGKQTRERSFTIAQDASPGDQKLDTSIWRGVVGDSTKSTRICGASVPIKVVV